MFNVIAEFVHSLSSTSIEVYEWSEAVVRKKRLPNSPQFSQLATQQPSLSFNGWGLAHAIVKADYLDRRSLWMPGIGFLLQASNLIDFGAAPVALKNGASKALNDFSLTSLSGRVGQGLTILYGHSLGMKFAAHLRSYVESLPTGATGVAHKNKAMADFLFANDQQSVLFESKGSFTLHENDPTAIKRVLKDALENQIDPWMSLLQPPPSNGYVVYSCLREDSWHPSALFVVDPQGDDADASSIPIGPDQVRRENYSAWLRAMGLNSAASRLVEPFSDGSEPSDEIFLLQEVNGRTYAFREMNYPWPRLAMWPSPFLGIDYKVLQSISRALHSPERGLQDMLADLPRQVTDGRGDYSIFPDGSILGHADYPPSNRMSVRL
ncbi:MAG: hypothetical protein H0W40_15035 [Methylibium sp.]|uniref:hypothetical protein n=1 Tax=Methylibium sp. TaxID=2067992 RepID=UPI0017B50A57|nr:hypothetical protein [Methylibium sp.]MBA3598672.1 hypothetical protein [Methylibium sp.]